MEAVVLAGGLGTRLRSVISEVPKPMAPVANRPFLDYILHYLKKQGITRVILAVGYKWEIIRDHYNGVDASFGIDIDYSIEDEPLGTGGAIFKAADKIIANDFFIINGDTSFDIPLNELKTFATEKSAEITIALKKISNSDRYGSVECSPDGRVISFKEKSPGNIVTQAEINGGIYFMQKHLINKFNFPGKFSFETDFLQENLPGIAAFAKAFDSTFIDIGIPEDYYRAQKIFENVIPI
ncbi:D-glycero-alpha-D-manno-heptose 1-phosphate guanylyltransferase [Mucilaginibacter oryzae]|uniref:D-glycero-alpha-D-manno-heptose 1-phosphate guanylyltransferase n=1 Tax=Mucilaginibacter oryzae TaxID=468058 RepID=A0A316HBR8_9SPHI|nr:nucleotidyltransferase family protein [Mucilaginibacter oryzae]PWK77733.1 D-glycero-alpha-D-manno-heptose 1-phosphate guanylyltransferase [Mucilaginibacter oryzae]